MIATQEDASPTAEVTRTGMDTTVYAKAICLMTLALADAGHSVGVMRNGITRMAGVLLTATATSNGTTITVSAFRAATEFKASVTTALPTPPTTLSSSSACPTSTAHLLTTLSTMFAYAQLGGSEIPTQATVYNSAAMATTETVATTASQGQTSAAKTKFR